MIVGYLLYSLITASPEVVWDQTAVPTEAVIYSTLDECKTHLRTDNDKPIEACVPVYRLKTKDNTMVDTVKEKLCN